MARLAAKMINPEWPLASPSQKEISSIRPKCDVRGSFFVTLVQRFTIEYGEIRFAWSEQQQPLPFHPRDSRLSSRTRPGNGIETRRLWYLRKVWTSACPTGEMEWELIEWRTRRVGENRWGWLALWEDRVSRKEWSLTNSGNIDCCNVSTWSCSTIWARYFTSL